MPPKPNRVTAANIKNKIKRLDWFLYLATQNSSKSRWCPWEIGYADGVKPLDRIVIIPTQDANGQNYGNEYLGLYRRVALSQSGSYGLFAPNGQGKLLRYVS